MLRDYADGIGELFWFGWIVGWIGVLSQAVGALSIVWITIYAFGCIVCLIDIAHTYYEDYFSVRTTSE